MMKNLLLEKMFRQYWGRITLLIYVLLFSACDVELQPVVLASQPTATAIQALESVMTPPASRTPLPVYTPTSISSTSRTLPRSAFLWGAELVEALRGGGYVIYIHNG